MASRYMDKGYVPYEHADETKWSTDRLLGRLAVLDRLVRQKYLSKERIGDHAHEGECIQFELGKRAVEQFVGLYDDEK